MIPLIKRYKYLLVLMILGLIAGTIWFTKNKQTRNQKQKESAYVVKKKDLTEELTLSGKVAAEETASLRFQTSGRLSWVGVKLGDTVNKYQAIASLDQTDVKKNLEKKLNTYMSERWDFEQTHDDYNLNGNPIAEAHLTDEEKRIVEKAQFDLNNAVIDVELYNLSVKYATLITPISGIVNRIDVPQAGVNVTPATAEFQVINPDSIYFSVVADQSEVVDLKYDLPAEIILDSYQDNTIKSNIYFISFTPKSGEASTVYEVKLKLTSDNSDMKYRIDMTGDATFITKKQKAVLSVPSNYVFEQNGKKYVKMQKNNKEQKVFIEISDEIDEYSVIKKGLKEGNVVYD